MSAARSPSEGGAAESRPSPFSRLPAASRALVLVVVTLATAASFTGQLQPSAGEWSAFGLVILLGTVSSIVSRRVERVRRALGDGLVPDLHGAWIVAGAVVLPPVLIATTTVLMFLAELPVRRTEHQQGATRRQPAYKLLYTVAAVALPAIAAHVVAGRISEPVLAVTSVVVVVVVANNGLVLAAIAASGQRQKLGLFFGSGTRQAVDVLSTVLGAILGSVLLAAGPNPSLIDLVAVLGVPALLVLQYASVAVEASQPEVTDPSTGVLSCSRLTELGQLELLHHPHSTVILVQLLEETPANLRAAAGVLRTVLDHDQSSGPRPLVGRSDAATFAILLVGVRPAFSAWRRTSIHEHLRDVGIAHMIAMGYSVTPVSRSMRSSCALAGSWWPRFLSGCLGGQSDLDRREIIAAKCLDQLIN